MSDDEFKNYDNEEELDPKLAEALEEDDEDIDEDDEDFDNSDPTEDDADDEEGFDLQGEGY